MDTTLLVATGVALAGALLAMVWLPAHAPEETAPEAVPDAQPKADLVAVG
jgi:hypothetical protein